MSYEYFKCSFKNAKFFYAQNNPNNNFNELSHFVAGSGIANKQK